MNSSAEFIPHVLSESDDDGKRVRTYSFDPEFETKTNS
jgi:hypothetical protein